MPSRRRGRVSRGVNAVFSIVSTGSLCTLHPRFLSGEVCPILHHGRIWPIVNRLYQFSGFRNELIFAGTGALTLYLNRGRSSSCAGNLRARKSPLPYTGSVLCDSLRAVIGLSFANVGLIVGWAIWFAMAVRNAPVDDQGRRWGASASKLFRSWH